MAKAAPKQFHLTSEERLRIENLQLRGQLLTQEQARIQGEQGVWAASVEKRTRCQLKDYLVDVTTGQCTQRVGPKAVPRPKPAAVGEEKSDA